MTSSPTSSHPAEVARLLFFVFSWICGENGEDEGAGRVTFSDLAPKKVSFSLATTDPNIDALPKLGDVPNMEVCELKPNLFDEAKLELLRSDPKIVEVSLAFSFSGASDCPNIIGWLKTEVDC